MAQKFIISATNPCHLYEMARELHSLNRLGRYYSGYPIWKLKGSERMPIQCYSARTLLVYGLLKFVPERYRFSNCSLFRWQDEAFDRAVALSLSDDSPVVAIPGQALETFRIAKRLGAKTILSHATGPLQTWIHLVKEEFQRVGSSFDRYAPVDSETLSRHQEEYEVADFHWAPSQIVKAQLIQGGIAEERIRVIAFGANPTIYHQGEGVKRSKRILFAGQLTWRKGLRLLDQVIPLLSPEVEIEFAGPFLEESREWVRKWSRDPRVKFLGPLSSERLAEKMRKAQLLILPSVEESFGLVVVQALSCGTPCFVSDCVGAQDLIISGENGAILSWDSPESWSQAIEHWLRNPRQTQGDYSWKRQSALFLNEFYTTVTDDGEVEK